MFDKIKMIEISIIVPVYNPGKEKLERCLNSITRQTFNGYEVILVDDGSNDETAEFCEEFCKLHNKFTVFHQMNKGVSLARNKGISESKGRYICFVDCDDYVKEDYLESLYTLINKEHSELAICGVEIINNRGIQLYNQQRDEEFWIVEKNDISSIIKLLENRYFNYVYSKLYIGDIIRNNNLQFNAELSLGEDILFVINYLKYVNHIILSGQNKYIYIKYDEGTLTSSKQVDKYIKLMEVNRNIEENFINNNLINSLLEKKIDERILMCADWAFESAELQENWLDKLANVEKILNSQNFINAVNRNGREILGFDFVLYKIQSAKVIVLTRKFKKIIMHNFVIVKEIIHKVFFILLKR